MSEVDGSCATVEIPYYGVPDLSRFLQHEINPQSSLSRGTAGLSADTSIANTVNVPEQNHVQRCFVLILNSLRVYKSTVMFVCIHVRYVYRWCWSLQ